MEGGDFIELEEGVWGGEGGEDDEGVGFRLLDCVGEEGVDFVSRSCLLPPLDMKDLKLLIMPLFRGAGWEGRLGGGTEVGGEERDGEVGDREDWDWHERRHERSDEQKVVSYRTREASPKEGSR